MSKRKHPARRHWFSVGVICIVLGSVVGLMEMREHRITATQTVTSSSVAVSSTSVSASASVSASSSSAASKKVTATAAAAAKRKKNIQTNLTNYLNKVVADGTASVSFYSLDPVAGSAAASDPDAAVAGAGTITAEANAHTWVTSASTYKLYIAAYLLNLHKQGSFSWDTTNTDGFTRMIVESANDYPESILTKYGKDSINAYIKSQGWGTPVFQTGVAAQTTSASLALLLRALANGTGTFTNSSDRAKMLSLMSKQEYRDGIPAGVASVTSGATVADKVGFLNDTNSDAGIVTLPDGSRYVMVILTHGRDQDQLDFTRIKAIATKVQTIVYGTDAGKAIVSYDAD